MSDRKEGEGENIKILKPCGLNMPVNRLMLTYLWVFGGVTQEKIWSQSWENIKSYRSHPSHNPELF